MTFEPPKKPTLRRFTWSRLHNDLLAQHLWALVAKRVQVPLALVEAFVVRLENHANSAQPRGYVGDFNIVALAAHWGVNDEALARLFAALEAPDVGWLEQDYVISFWERNPDIADNTAAERQQRHRQRQKVERAAWREARAKGSFPQSRDVTRDTVTVTTRSDQIINLGRPVENAAAAASQVIQGQSGSSGDNAIEPELWLATSGRQIVAARLNEEPAKAQLRIERWQRELGGELATLVSILERLQASDLVVSQFLVMVTEAIRRHRIERNGPQLPLPPALASHGR